MKSGEQEAEEEVVGEEDANLPIVDESLKPSADLLSSFFYFRNEFDELEMDADSPLVPQNGGKSVHTLLEYDVFKCMYPSRSPTIISPVSPRSALSVHICSMLGSPAALTVPFSPAMALHADPTFVSNYFQPYPLAFSGGRTCLSLKSNGPKGRGPELSQEEVRKAASNFLFASVSSVFRRCCFPSSLLYGLALSARDYFGVGQSREVWLGELASTPGSRRRAHFCRTDGASAHTSVIHLSTASSTTASISSSLPSTEASLSIVIRTPIKPTVSVPPAQNLPPIKLIPSGSTSFIASRKNKASFIVSRQKKKKRKVKPSIRLAEPRPAPLRIVLKCAEEKPLAPIPTIRIKFPLENKVEVPKIRLKVVNPNAER
ncbi:hypothetical protein DI09_24p80 [Mitosporidium daphniae]|uniref:Uncharacterized protein n=1 Tax=Mitosporidium daphniae TaxID=1485682 RepID=A0A098VSE4_9MICR|nr:uncharacterized protein DI09_24p80 [Mitosporidium daphniae]KGG51887.1 hypothetical protein DI09_24p80 [Mitosporidium daphniae]|eukprot:XP_013238348.1 uncharacterized protein DI09_24p80 [Mitosporidium daphniae]